MVVLPVLVLTERAAVTGQTASGTGLVRLPTAVPARLQQQSLIYDNRLMAMVRRSEEKGSIRFVTNVFPFSSVSYVRFEPLRFVAKVPVGTRRWGTSCCLLVPPGL